MTSKTLVVVDLRMRCRSIRKAFSIDAQIIASIQLTTLHAYMAAWGAGKNLKIAICTDGSIGQLHGRTCLRRCQRNILGGGYLATNLDLAFCRQTEVTRRCGSFPEHAYTDTGLCRHQSN